MRAANSVTAIRIFHEGTSITCENISGFFTSFNSRDFGQWSRCVKARQALSDAENSRRVSYSTARSWFHLSGFPAFRAVVFWQDFVQWRTGRNNLKEQGENNLQPKDDKAVSNLPPRAEQILRAA
jgi:hypothetical protein